MCRYGFCADCLIRCPIYYVSDEYNRRGRCESKICLECFGKCEVCECCGLHGCCVSSGNGGRCSACAFCDITLGRMCSGAYVVKDSARYQSLLDGNVSDISLEDGL
jgi:hypothetical protein